MPNVPAEEQAHTPVLYPRPLGLFWAKRKHFSAEKSAWAQTWSQSCTQIMRYPNAALGMTVRLLSQFIAYFGSFNLSSGGKKKKKAQQVGFLLFVLNAAWKQSWLDPRQKYQSRAKRGFVTPREGATEPSWSHWACAQPCIPQAGEPRCLWGSFPCDGSQEKAGSKEKDVEKMSFPAAPGKAAVPELRGSGRPLSQAVHVT